MTHILTSWFTMTHICTIKTGLLSRAMFIDECGSLALRARFSLAIDHGLATVYRFERGFTLVADHVLASVRH